MNLTIVPLAPERTKHFAETLPGTLESSIPSAKEVVL